MSYRAQDLVTGREVTVHLLTGISAFEAEHLRGQLHRLDSQDHVLVLAEMDVEGTPGIVTEALPDFTTLPAWLEARAPKAMPEPKGTPGEFTQVFGALPPDLPVAPVSPPRPIPPLSDVPPAGPLGNFFGPSDPPRAQRPVIRLGGSAPAAPLSPVPPPASPFQLPDLSRPTDERPLFGNDLVSTGPKRPWSATPFDNPAAAPPPSSAPARGPADIAELIASASAPGSTGRREVQSPAPRADAAGTSSEQPSERRSYLPLILILAVLLLCAAGLVLFFALAAG
jgi:hypothetical protein